MSAEGWDFAEARASHIRMRCCDGLMFLLRRNSTVFKRASSRVSPYTKNDRLFESEIDHFQIAGTMLANARPAAVPMWIDRIWPCYASQPSLPMRSDISSAESMASQPLLPLFTPARSRACSSVSQVKTPNMMGRPLRNDSEAMPLATSAAT